MIWILNMKTISKRSRYKKFLHYIKVMTEGWLWVVKPGLWGIKKILRTNRHLANLTNIFVILFEGYVAQSMFVIHFPVKVVHKYPRIIFCWWSMGWGMVSVRRYLQNQKSIPSGLSRLWEKSCLSHIATSPGKQEKQRV